MKKILLFMTVIASTTITNAQFKVNQDGTSILREGTYNNNTPAILFFGDYNHSIRSEYGSGLRFSTTGIPNGIVLKETGRVGIGTINPKDQLDIAHLEPTKLRLSHLNGANNFTGVSSAISFYKHVGAYEGASIYTFNDFSEHSYYGADLRFRTNQSNNNSFDIMTIKSNGKVGIGTTNPQGDYKLTVQGKLHVTSQIYLNGNFIQSSDKSIKKNIKEIPLNNYEKILQMRGVSYNFIDFIETDEIIGKDYILPDGSKETRFERSKIKHSNKENNDKLHYGFIAQELALVYPNLVSEMEDGKLAVNYIELIPILLEAIKVQHTSIETLQAKVTKLEGKKATARKQDDQTIIFETISGAYLYQNTPNPFSEETQIKYFIPESVNDAFITITDLTGKQIKSISISKKGESYITVQANQLTAGLYVYALIADGNIIDTKRMVIVE